MPCLIRTVPALHGKTSCLNMGAAWWSSVIDRSVVERF